MRRFAYLGAIALTAGAGALIASLPGAREFPHQKHAALGAGGCESCHAGIYTGDATQLVSADPQLCAGCHNGEMLPEVEYQGYVPSGRDLKFTHVAHPALGCAACHGAAAETEMAVQPARAETCLPCHGEGATEHLAVGENPCTFCHYDPAPGHTPEFATQHGTAAGASQPDCASCHAEDFCVACHDGPVAKEFQYHPANFVMRHGAESWSSVMECAECHSTEVFCRECHAAQGVAQDGRSGGGYHDGVSNWLQQHGVAARQGLESCVSCHQQTECLACHSAKAGWRVNPHGPDFDPSRVEDRSKQSCATCHFGY